MDSVDKVDSGYKVDPTGRQRPRQRRGTDEEFKILLDLEEERSENKGGEDKEREDDQTGGTALPGTDVVDIRIESVHNVTDAERIEDVAAGKLDEEPELHKEESPTEPEESPAPGESKSSEEAGDDDPGEDQHVDRLV